ncbi:MAG: hypothetical protein B7C24_08510 [Bacteroidetes bacterium 4572_77]|nr:MAG: hypothetical protein B7C24_08510 [Bacteroidetes bacterium 4572_77]
MKKKLILLVLVLIGLSSWAKSQSPSINHVVDIKKKSINAVMEQYLPHLFSANIDNPFSFVKNLNQGKSIFEVKQVLDSMLTYEEDYVVEIDKYVYNTAGQCLEMLFYIRSESEVMTPYNTMTFTYWPNGSVKNLQYKRWRIDLNDWEPFFRIEYTYENDLLWESQLSTWDTEISQWEINTKDYYEYDDKDCLISIISKAELLGSWENFYKQEYDYTADEFPYLWVDYNWAQAEWVPITKQEKFFNTNGDVELSLESTWVAETKNWIDFYRTNYINNDNHQRIEAVYASYDEINQQWYNVNKDELAYDEYGNRNYEANYIWENENWLAIAWEELVFDYSYAAHELLYPARYDIDFTHMLVEVNYSFSENSAGDDYSNILYYSPKDINGLQEISQKRMALYPNPNNGVFSVEIGDDTKLGHVSIVNLLGQVIVQEDIHNPSSLRIKKLFDLSDYKSGVYFLHLSSETKSEVCKFEIR